MRLIDADKLRKDVLDLPNCYNGFSDTYDKAMIVDLVDEQPTVNAEPTEEQVKEYCRKRCLVVVDSGLFNEMKARWSGETVKHGRWIDHQYKNYPIGRYECSVCGAYHDIDWKNCPDCGAKMNEVE